MAQEVMYTIIYDTSCKRSGGSFGKSRIKSLQARLCGTMSNVIGRYEMCLAHGK